jgi:hypothetical protein
MLDLHTNIFGLHPLISPNLAEPEPNRSQALASIFLSREQEYNQLGPMSFPRLRLKKIVNCE